MISREMAGSKSTKVGSKESIEVIQILNMVVCNIEDLNYGKCHKVQSE